MEQHGFIIKVEIIEQGDYATAFRAALETAQHIFDASVDEASILVEPTGERLFQSVPNGVYCEGCEGCIYPGIRWPTHTNGDDSRCWVERCDTCERYESDEAAADQVVAIYEDSGADRIERGQAIAAGTINPTPYVEVE